MGRSYQTELTTACMIYDRATGDVLVQERTNGDWTGLCFPGGHVEDGESYADCVIREVREETGLEIRNPRQEGIVHWENRDTHARTVIVFFRADEFSGALKPSCDEAKNRWTPLRTLRSQPLVDWFAEQYAVYEDPALQEMYYAYGRNGTDKPRFYRASGVVPSDRDEDLLSRVRRAALAMQRHDWEQGVLAQAFLESGDEETAALMAVEGANRQGEDGRCCQLSAGSGATDPCAIGEALIAACERTNDPALRRARDRLLDWALTGAPRNAEGIVYHFAGKREFWVDSFYMLPPFLARAGFFDEAMKQMDGWWRALYNEDNGLLSHRWDDGAQRYIRRDAWGVGNGWALAGMCRVAGLLPEDRADERRRLTERIRAILTAARACQRADGLFHDVLDAPSTFVEVNFAQMFAYTIYRGVAEGWLDPAWLESAEKARAAAVRAVDQYGLVRGVCGAPRFDRPGVAPEGQAFFILMESARSGRKGWPGA